MATRLPEFDINEHHRRETIVGVIDFVDKELVRIQSSLAVFQQLRHDIFTTVDNTPFDPDVPIFEQLNPEPSYNDEFPNEVIGLRKAVEFHTEKEKYNPLPDDSAELSALKRTWRPLVMKKGLELGFISDTVGKSDDEKERWLGIQPNQFEGVDEPVEAMVVAAAAGISTHKRLFRGIQDIESGRVKTNKLIIAAGERNVPLDEQGRIEAIDVTSGKTEYESAVIAAETLLGISFDDTDALAVPYGPSDLRGEIAHGIAVIGDQVVDVYVVDAPINPRRDLEGGKKADRANTEETFLALDSLLERGNGTIVLESHDTWKNYQNAIALKSFGIMFGKNVITTGPDNDERLFYNDEGQLDIHMAEGVQDEIAKYSVFLTDLRVKAENELLLLSRPDNYAEAVFGFDQPVPDMTDALAAREGYRTKITIDTTHEKYNEPLVRLKDLDIPSQSYYSRPNEATGEPLPEVESDVWLRRSVALKIHELNQHLRDPSITEFFGGEVELYVEEGLRSVSTQKVLFYEAMPRLVREQHPEYSDEEVEKRVKQLAAEPTTDPNSPAPHATGGVFDIVLRYKQHPHEDGTRPFVDGVAVPMDHFDGQTGPKTHIDYFERNEPKTADEKLAQRNRRAFYRIMTGEAFGIETGFTVTPTELWHWGIGDQLSAAVSGKPAYYGIAEQN
ncbi:MAG: hypothetical protein WAO28_03030 [Candidatus Microsaccharimonas sp.]